MKKLLTGLFVIAAAVFSLFITGCFKDDNNISSPTVIVWELNTHSVKCTNASEGCTTGEYYIDTTYPLTDNRDVDGDGTDEMFVKREYRALDNGTLHIYNSYDVTDDGTDTTTSASYGLVDGTYHCSEDDSAYTLTGDMYLINGSEYTIEISGATMTMTNLTDFTLDTLSKTEISPAEFCFSYKKKIQDYSSGKI